MVQRATEIILETPGVRYCVAFAGFSGATARQQPQRRGDLRRARSRSKSDSREGLTGQVMLATLQEKLTAIPDADIFVIPPPPVQGLGTSGGFKFVVQDRARRVTGTAGSHRPARRPQRTKRRRWPACSPRFARRRRSSSPTSIA